MPKDPASQPEEYTPEETSRRLDQALKRSLSLPPKGRPDGKLPKPKHPDGGK